MKQTQNAMHPLTHSSPELRLLLGCARWPQTGEDRDFIRRHAAMQLDWQSFLRLVCHHRLVPLVAQNLSNALGEISFHNEASREQQAALDELKKISSAGTYRSLQSLAELRRLIQQFETCGIPVRVLKGLPLAVSIFGNLGLRACGDLDLLIDEDSILAADEILRDFGYEGLFDVDRFTPKRLAFYRSHYKDIAYANPATGFEVDLHWRCFRNREMPGTSLCLTADSHTVSFGNFQVATLPPREGLLYLCVHGALDGWIYLKSLSDVAAQVRTMSVYELDGMAVMAAQYSVLPELTAALTLVRRYLGIDHWSPHLLPESDPTVQHILRYADHSLVDGGFVSERENIGMTTVIAFELGLRSNLRYRFELLIRLLYRARMWKTIPLPDLLFVFYPLLSPFEWAFFHLRRRFGKPEPSLPLSI